MPPQFLYFDLGNVLLRFSHERMARQMASVSGTSPDRAWQILFQDGSGLEWAYERGQLTRDQFYDQFCRAAGVPLGNIDQLDTAGNDIFEVDPLAVGLAGKLAAAGYRLGILSNTSHSHWTYCISRFGALTTVFSVHALSYRLGAIKPSPQIFRAAAELAGVPPARIFFTDDREQNITAARDAGFDAVRYESVSQLNEVLRRRGVLLNY
jgi:putative hydrolase of the HAD superfamily